MEAKENNVFSLVAQQTEKLQTRRTISCDVGVRNVDLGWKMERAMDKEVKTGREPQWFAKLQWGCWDAAAMNSQSPAIRRRR